MKHLSNLFFLVIMTLSSLYCNSQITVFSYSSIPNQTFPNNCFFNGSPGPTNPTLIGGYNHYGVSGGVKYDGSVFSLKTNYLGNGTAFGIYFPFSQGYNYKVEIEARQIIASGGVNNLLRSATNNSRTHVPTNCNPEFVGYLTNGPDFLSTTSTLTNTLSNYTVINNYTPTTSGINYLLFGALPGGNTTTSTPDGFVEIKKVTITATSNCLIAAPTNLQTTYVSNNIANVSWTRNKFAQSHTIEYKKQSSSVWIIVQSSQNQPQSSINYGFSNLDPGTTYDWRIKSNCSLSEGVNYAQSQFTTSGCIDPTNLAASNVTDNSASITWSPSPNANSYTFYCEKAITHEVVVPNTILTSTNYNITGLAPLTSYSVMVSTNCASGSSSIITVGILTTGLCPNVSNLNTGTITCNSAVLTWTHPTSPALWFAALDYKESSSSTWIPINTFPITTPFTLSSLNASTTYDWRVRSQCWGLSGNYLQGQFTTLPGSCRGIVSQKENRFGYLAVDKDKFSVNAKLNNKRNDVSEEKLIYDIYPSPANNIIYISLDNILETNTNIQIVSTLGSVLYSKNFNNTKNKIISIDASKYPNGFYIIKITEGNKITNKKIIIQH
jgi:Secretion system C-terminal sorting domain/Fibronectin type III domain